MSCERLSEASPEATEDTLGPLWRECAAADDDGNCAHKPTGEACWLELQAENARLRTALWQKRKLIDEAVHQLRSPITSLIGYSSLLEREQLHPETRRKYARTIADEVRHLAHLVDTLEERRPLGAARVEANFAKLVELDRLLREQVDLFRGQSALHELRLSLPREPLWVDGDAERLTQVIGNLLSNAIKYSPSGGEILVGVESSPETVRVSVTDSGIGIPSEQQHLIFGRFFRVQSSKVEGIEGSGLGLALAREIIQSHGGSIGFESNDGEGSSFWFELKRWLG